MHASPPRASTRSAADKPSQPPSRDARDHIDRAHQLEPARIGCAEQAREHHAGDSGIDRGRDILQRAVLADRFGEGGEPPTFMATRRASGNASSRSNRTAAMKQQRSSRSTNASCGEGLDERDRAREHGEKQHAIRGAMARLAPVDEGHIRRRCVWSGVARRDQ